MDSDQKLTLYIGGGILLFFIFAYILGFILLGEKKDGMNANASGMNPNASGTISSTSTAESSAFIPEILKPDIFDIKDTAGIIDNLFI